MLEQTEPPVGHCPCCPHAAGRIHHRIRVCLRAWWMLRTLRVVKHVSSFSTTGNSSVRCHFRRAQLLSRRFLWYCRENTSALIVPGKSFRRFFVSPYSPPKSCESPVHSKSPSGWVVFEDSAVAFLYGSHQGPRSRARGHTLQPSSTRPMGA